MDPQNDEEKKLPEPTIADLKEELAEAIARRDEYLGGWQRSKADFINYKKEEAKNFEEMAKYGSEKLLKELLSLLHTFDLALKDMERTREANGGEEKGISLIRSQLEDIVRRRGVEKIELNPGDMFDPATAEAMMEVESKAPPGSIVEIMEPGYRLHDKVIRAARVSISKEPSEA
jgi:molecular chaperone GrpE